MKLIFSRFLSLTTLLVVFALTPAFTVAQTEKPSAAPTSAGATRNDSLHVFSQSVQALTATVTKSVVQIVATGYGFSSGKDSNNTALFEPQEAIGAGVILSSDGYIVTNAHVVQGARRIRVRLPGLEAPGPDGSKPHGPVTAKLVGLDRQSDLAVLKVDLTDLPALPLADSDELKQGQVVFAFGSPQGLENSVTMGVVSARLARTIPRPTCRPMRPLIPAIAAARWWMWTAAWWASTPSSSPSPAAAKGWASPSPATWCATFTSSSRPRGTYIADRLAYISTPSRPTSPKD